MSGAAGQDTYGNRGWGQKGESWGNNTPWGAGQWSQQSQGWDGSRPMWGGPPFWHPAGLSRPMAILFTVLGFLFWWPVGLAILFYMVGTGRMGCFGRKARRAMYQGQNGGGQAPWSNWMNWASGAGTTQSSGNHAFDEYRAETLRRLEEEQKEFGAFLERLRFAKDKAEFDQFMAERRNQPPSSPTDEKPAA